MNKNNINFHQPNIQPFVWLIHERVSGPENAEWIKQVGEVSHRLRVHRPRLHFRLVDLVGRKHQAGQPAGPPVKCDMEHLLYFPHLKIEWIIKWGDSRKSGRFAPHPGWRTTVRYNSNVPPESEALLSRCERYAKGHCFVRTWNTCSANGKEVGV